MCKYEISTCPSSAQELVYQLFNNSQAVLLSCPLAKENTKAGTLCEWVQVHHHGEDTGISCTGPKNMRCNGVCNKCGDHLRERKCHGKTYADAMYITAEEDGEYAHEIAEDSAVQGYDTRTETEEESDDESEDEPEDETVVAKLKDGTELTVSVTGRPLTTKRLEKRVTELEEDNQKLQGQLTELERAKDRMALRVGQERRKRDEAEDMQRHLGTLLREAEQDKASLKRKLGAVDKVFEEMDEAAKRVRLETRGW